MKTTASKAKTAKRAAGSVVKSASGPARKGSAAKGGKTAAAEAANRHAVVAGGTSPESRHEKWPAREVEIFRRTLLQMRDQLTGQIESLKVDALTREDAVNSEEDGTDAFERQFALNIARAESHSVAEIDDALKRLQDSRYGVCEECGGLVGKARLAALPFVRLCIGCKSKQEIGRPHFVPIVAETVEPPTRDREPRERE